MNNNLNNLTDNSSKITILLIVFGIILLIFVFIMVYINYKKYNQYKIQDFIEEELLETIHNCKNELLTIPGEQIPSSSLGNEYSINMWLYVNDYGYKYGEPKYVLMKGSTNKTNGFYNSSNPGIYLDSTKNDLVVDIELQSNTQSNTNVPSSSDDISYATCRLSNIPLQRWFCVHLSLHNNIMDVYLDGKLFKSCIFDGFPKPNNHPMYFGFDGGFDGYVSRITWANKNLSPEQIYNRYEEGPRILENPIDSIKSSLGLNE